MYYPTDQIQTVKGVGEYLAKVFKQNNIKYVGDLLNYFPFRHEDLSQISTIQNISTDKTQVFKGEFFKVSTFFTKTKKQITKGYFSDQTGKIEVLWFNSTYISKQIKEGQTYLVTCKPSLYNNKVNLVNPQIEQSEKTLVNTGRVVPVYFNINGIHLKKLRKIMLQVVQNTQINDFLQTKDLISLKQAYKLIHFPTNLSEVEQAKDRIAFNELLHIKLHSLKLKQKQQAFSSKFSIKKDYSKSILKTIPFKLTKDQNTTNTKITKLLKQNKPINALVSGDVGSGKTIVAILASYNVFKNGGKVLYLAPTVVLANQIYKEYLKYFKKSEVALITSKTTKEKRQNLPNIVIGTHAVLNLKNINTFANLVIIDEQHKFGVKQRAKIIETNSKNLPHVITMTATPIPRSLALTYFNELTLFQIKTKPKGRQKIITKVLPESKRKDCYKWIKQKVISNNSIYYITPFISTSESDQFKNVKSVEETQKLLTKEFGKQSVVVLHGKMKDEEKTQILNNFKKQRGGILLSTQVVEVGIDISDATVIIIESAERFGLASLHQLRGRVGRSSLKSYCFLFTSEGKGVSDRLKNMEKYNNGFKLAEIDLKTRGSGEIFGIRQSGEIDLKFVDFSNTKLIEQAGEVAQTIFNDENLLSKYKQNFFTRDLFKIKDN